MKPILRSLLLLLLLLPATFLAAQVPDRQPDKVVTPGWSPAVVSASTGFEVILRSGREDKIEIYSDNLEAVKCDLNSAKRSIHLGYKIKWSKGSHEINELLAVITLRDPGRLTKLKAELGSDITLDTNRLFSAKIPHLELKSYTGSEIRFEGRVDDLSATAGTGSSLVLGGRHTTLRLKCTTGSEIEYKGTFTTGDLRASTGSTIGIAGRGKTVNIVSSGGSDVSGSDLVVDTATLDADISSSLSLSVTDLRRVTREGKGDFTVTEVKHRLF